MRNGMAETGLPKEGGRKKLKVGWPRREGKENIHCSIRPDRRPGKEAPASDGKGKGMACLPVNLQEAREST